MRIPRCAPAWLLKTAQTMVASGSNSLSETQAGWIESWQTALRWKQAKTFSALAYYTEGPFDDTMQTQLLDAFSRTSKRKLVAIVDETEHSAICFFGGVPANVELATLDFKQMDITKPKRI